MSSEQVVRDMLAAWKRFDIDELVSYFTEDAVYDNVPRYPVYGRDCIRKLLEELKPHMTEIDYVITKLGAFGDYVTTERLDYFHFDGKPCELPVMGAFEIRDGRISAWRDYYDRQQSGAGV